MYNATLAGKSLEILMDSLAFHKFMAHKDALEVRIHIKTVKDLKFGLRNGSKAGIVGETTVDLNTEGQLSTESI